MDRPDDPPHGGREGLSPSAAWPKMDGAHLGRDHEWRTDPLELAWCGRLKDLDGLRSFAGDLPAGPHRDFIQAFLDHRAGRVQAAFGTVERLLQEDPFDSLWTARLDQLHVALLHALGLTAQALEAAQRGLVTARASGNPTALFYALHVYGVVLERTDGPRTQALYMQVVDLIDAVEDAPAHARDELEALRGVAVFNSHLFADRTHLPLLPGTPGLQETQERCALVWPALAAAIQAFRGIQAHAAGDRDAARAILAGLPHPGTLHDAPRSVIVATGITVSQVIDGRHDEALALADELIGSVPPEFVPEALVMKARIYEDLGDYERAYEVAFEVIDAQGRLYGAEAQKTVRALEVFYRTDDHRDAAESARRQGEVIASQAEEWRRTSLRDGLTDLWNRRYLQKQFDELAGSTGHQLAVLDVDAFKGVNDHFGHAAGDDVLMHVADAISTACRPDDVVARLGGDEFCVLRPAADPHPLGDDLDAICRPPRSPESPDGEVTVSVGVTVVGEDGFPAAYARADAAMYEVKRSGGGGVRVA